MCVQDRVDFWCEVGTFVMTSIGMVTVLAGLVVGLTCLFE